MPSMARRPKFASSQYSANMLVMRILDQWKMLDKSIEIFFLAPCPHFLSPFNVPSHHVYSSCCFVYTVLFHIMFFIYMYFSYHLVFDFPIIFFYLLPFHSNPSLLSGCFPVKAGANANLAKTKGSSAPSLAWEWAPARFRFGDIFADSFR